MFRSEAYHLQTFQYESFLKQGQKYEWLTWDLKNYVKNYNNQLVILDGVSSRYKQRWFYLQTMVQSYSMCMSVYIYNIYIRFYLEAFRIVFFN
jgi:hypothetical protein